MTTTLVGHVAECVCDDCWNRWNSHRREVVAYRASGLGWSIVAIDKSAPQRHGRYMYKKGCRCDTCKQEQSDYMQLRRNNGNLNRRGL